MDTFYSDLKQSLRMFLRNPGFTAAVLAALALGIGASTAIFSVVNAVLLKPLSYPNPERMVQFLLTSPNRSGPGSTVTTFHIWQEQTGVFRDVAAYDYPGLAMNLTGSAPEQIHGIHVTEAYFQLFGAPVAMGRTFTPDEDKPNGGHVVVISNGLWKRRFGGDQDIVGKTIALSNVSYTVVGVIAPNFDSDPAADVWLPFQFDPNSSDQAEYFRVAGRLKPAITLRQANEQLKLTAMEFRRRYPGVAGPQQGFMVQPLQDSIVGDVRSSLLVLMGAVSFVFLISCSNVANLLLVRATGRAREFALRASLGAGRGRIIRQLLTESVILAFTGGLLGLFLGLLGVRVLLAVSPDDIPRISEKGSLGLDWHVLLFTMAISGLTGIIFGLIPSLIASRPDLIATMKEGSSRSGIGSRLGKLRSLLVISEVSLGLVLLVGAALLVKTFLALREVAPGFDSRNVLTMEMSVGEQRFEKTSGLAQLVQSGRERINAIPGVTESAVASTLPLVNGFGMQFDVVGRPANGAGTPVAGWEAVSPGYLAVFNIPLLRGRDFTDRDNRGAPNVVIINEAMARKFWRNQDPLEQQVMIGRGGGPEFEDSPRQIIGIIGDVRGDGLDRDPQPLMLVPVAQLSDAMAAMVAKIVPISWIMRTRVEPHQVASAATAALREASGGLPVGRIRSMDEVVVHSTTRQRFAMLLLTVFGVSALVLAAIGIYGLMAYSVQQRVQEIGVRLALGANRTQIRNMVVWQGMRLALTGVLLGIGGAFALAHLLDSFLFDVKSSDPAVFIVVSSMLIGVSFFSVWVPAQRASRLDPMQALRTE